jgi:hypothetical protein
MDHRIANDMISSGMIPSGEKKKEDLSRTQYGSAPSPSALADVYKKMYEVDEEIDPMDFGKSKRTEEEKSKSRNLQSRLGNKKTQAQRKDQLKGTQIKTSTDSVDSTPKPTPTSKGFGESSLDLLAAYNAVYEHHKKDADGNTIPHEDEEVNEGKIPAGLQAYLDKKKGKKEDKKEVKEEIDTYDIVLDHFLNEGYEREDILKVMSTVNLTEEPITATLAAIGAGLAKGASVAAKGAAVAAKGAMGAVKAGSAALKSGMKGVVSAAKGGISNVKSGMKGVTDAAKNVIKPKPKVTSSGGDVVQGSSDTGGNKILDFAKRETGNYARQKVLQGGQPSGTDKTQRTSAAKTDVAASADLFDIVKGQLLDEGLSEEEIKDIMLTLTPDEILKEMEDKPMEVNVADAKANTPAYQNYMKGMKRKTDGKPMYTASQDMKDRAKGLK